MTDQHGDPHQTNISETLQSLIVAFVLAMTARGFVVEGFVIPTGSMAPTLLGEHGRLESRATGWSYPVDGRNLAQRIVEGARMQQGVSVESEVRRGAIPIYDPMVGLTRPAERVMPREMTDPRQPARVIRAGDRVLVLKYLEPVLRPRRWDVVVLKNPTDPVGNTQNFIKRLVGTPSEQFVIVDGDIFAAPLDASPDDRLARFLVQRKPEHVQRGVWQPVYRSDRQPFDVTRLEQSMGHRWDGPPFAGERWTTRGETVWRTDSNGPTQLAWDEDQWPITDFNVYNVFRRGAAFLAPLDSALYAVSDLRVGAAIEPVDHETFSTEFELAARGRTFTFALRDGEASIAISGGNGADLVESVEFAMPGGPFDVEFWHVDQQCTIFVDGDPIVALPYDMPPVERLEASHGVDVDTYMRDPLVARPEPPRLLWRFDGSALALRNVRVDRDLHYRPTRLDAANQYAANGSTIFGWGFGTDLRAPSVIGPDQYLMCGDNSEASRDGRIWGRPHPLAAEYTGDPTPFVVPRELLVGKAFSVYFPSPLPWTPNGRKLIPDFGRMRFIR